MGGISIYRTVKAVCFNICVFTANQSVLTAYNSLTWCRVTSCFLGIFKIHQHGNLARCVRSISCIKMFNPLPPAIQKECFPAKGSPNAVREQGNSVICSRLEYWRTKQNKKKQTISVQGQKITKQKTKTNSQRGY